MTDNLHEERDWLITGSLVVLAVVALGFSLSYTRGVLIPFVLAIFITTIVSPVVDFQVLELKFSRTFAVVNALLIVLLVFLLVGLVVISSIQNILASVGEYSKSFTTLSNSLLGQLETWNVEIEAGQIEKQIRGELPRYVTSTIGSLVGLLSQGVLVFVFVGFLLAGRNPHIVRTGVYADVDTQVRRYLATKFAISSVTGVLVWLTLRWFGLKLAFVFGWLAFMLNFIPSIGSIISTVLPLPTAVAQFNGEYLMILGVLAIPGAIQMTIGNVIEPKLLGEGLKLHPVIILLALAFWGLLWGPIGMLLAVPMTATIRIVFEQFAITESAGRLLAGHLPAIGTTDSASRGS